MASVKYTYKAFISYSHRDEKWAAWLHRALESYRLPHKLKGSTTARGLVPARVKPVFRDRDELTSAADLAETVKQALAESENLVVVCSPAAAESRWVNEEIRHFAALGRQDRIFCMIVDGDPAGDRPDTACFPPALAEIGMTEPLAADVRRWADGKRLSRLKLIAGMLGLPLDQLRRRDLQKRQRTWALAAVASALVLAVLVTAVTSRIAAEQRRDSGESLVAYKLNELRTLLNVSQDPAELHRLGAWDAGQLSRLVADAGTGEDALSAYAMELRDQGITAWRAGALAEAMDLFQYSWALLAEAYRRDDGKLEIFFELGQADFWIGQAYRDLGALEAAVEPLTAYAEITRQLIVQQPENAEWVLEMAFALTNLGSLQRELDAGNPERALHLLQSALEYNQIALVLDPANEYYRSELGQSHAFLADAQFDVCDLEGAFLSRQKQLALEQEILAGDDGNTAKMQRLAWAFSGYAVVQDSRGDVAGAVESYRRALQWMEPVAWENPDTRSTQRFMLDRRYRTAMLLADQGETEAAAVVLNEIEEQWRALHQAGEVYDEDLKKHAGFLLGRARLAQAMGAAGSARQYVANATAVITSVLEKLPGDRDAGNLVAQAAYQHWVLTGALPSQAVLDLL
ncbi:MAG: toll/interleukin-1 receptor domain-containing protein, partial [Lysobacterales bacterium]